MNLKVLIIAPPYPLEEAPSPPLGICYAASAFIKAGAEVRMIDYIVSGYSKEELSEELLSFRPDVVGCSSVTMNFYEAIGIMGDVKEILPTALTSMGGPHVSFCSKETLTEYPFLDLIFKGEADETIVEFMGNFHSKNSWSSVKGLVFRDGDKIIDTGKRDFIEDLDSLPLPARELLPVSRYKALGFPVSIITSRGCPGMCIFCLGRKMVGQKVRKRSVKNVVDEIETILNMGFEFINIADDLFTADRQRVIEICDEIIKRDLKFLFSVFSRVNTIDYDLLVKMKEAGLHAVSFGIESGNVEMLKRIRKGITLKQAELAIEACKKADVRSHVSFMAGLPGESHETLQDSVKCHKKLSTEFGYHLLAPFPGTTVREEIENYDLTILTDNWRLYDAKNPVVKTNALNADDLKNFVDDAYKDIRENWEGIVTRGKEGTLSNADRFSLDAYHRLKLIYLILKENIIERGAKSVDDLVSMVLEKEEFENGFVDRIIKNLMDRKLISLTEKGFSWV